SSAQELQGELEESQDFRLAEAQLDRVLRDGAERRELLQRRAANLGRSPRHDEAHPLLEEPTRSGQAHPAGPPHDQACAAVEPAGTLHGRTPLRTRRVDGTERSSAGTTQRSTGRGIGGLRRDRPAPPLLRPLQFFTWKMASISTAMPLGSAPMPTALR